MTNLFPPQLILSSHTARSGFLTLSPLKRSLSQNNNEVLQISSMHEGSHKNTGRSLIIALIGTCYCIIHLLPRAVVILLLLTASASAAVGKSRPKDNAMRFILELFHPQNWTLIHFHVLCRQHDIALKEHFTIGDFYRVCGR